jgi:hypothetical protein
VIAKAQGENNELSHSDRASEYNTILKTMCLLREVIGESAACSQTYDIASAPGYTELDFKEKDAESLACHEKDKRTLSQFTWTRPERTQAGPPAAESSYEKVESQAMDLEQMKQKWCSGSPSSCKDGDVRQQGSESNTEPQIFWSGQWYPICGHHFWDNENGAKTFCSELGGSLRRLEQERSDYEKDAMNVGSCRPGEKLHRCTARDNAFGQLDYKDGWCNKDRKWGGRGISIKILCDGATRSSTCDPDR